MLPIKPTNPYDAVVSKGALFRGGDGKTAFKVYFVDIVGRKDPARTEWDKCGLTRDDFLVSLGKVSGLEGIGFITAFPHITKAFRFGPEAEIVMNVRAWQTKGMADLSLARSDAYLEYACLAEALLSRDEFEYWAAAPSVAHYLATWSPYRGGRITNKDKLLQYWSAGAAGGAS